MHGIMHLTVWSMMQTKSTKVKRLHNACLSQMFDDWMVDLDRQSKRAVFLIHTKDMLHNSQHNVMKNKIS